MVWSEQTKAALRHWLEVETWHTNDAADMTRFFKFVASVWNDEHARWGESTVREKMTNEVKELYSGCNDILSNVIEKRMTEGMTVLEFLFLLHKDKAFSLITEG